MIGALAVLALGAPGQIPVGDLELFQNGGFEYGLAGWTTYSNSKAIRYEPDRNEKTEGGVSLRLERSGGSGWDFLKQFADLPAGHDELVLRMSYKVEKKGRVEAVFYFFDADGAEVGKGRIPVLNSGRTKRFEVLEEQLDIPEKATRCGIDVILKQAGTVWIDAVSVSIPGAGLPELGPLELANPSFDADLEWWRELEHASGRTTARRDAKVKAKGKGALCLDRESPRLYPEDGVWARAPELGKAKKVRLGLSVRVEQGARGAIVLQAVDAQGAVLATARAEIAPTGPKFSKEKLDLALPPGAMQLEVSLRVQGAGRVWYDALELRKR